MRQENLRVPKEPAPAVNRWTLPNLCLKKLCVYKTRCCWSTVFSWWPLLAPACWKEIFFSATVLWETILITLLFLCKPGDERAQNTEEKNTANKKTLTLVVNWGMLENQWQSKGRSEVLCFGKDYLNFSQQAPLEMKMKRSRAFPLCFSITPCMRPYVFVLILLSPCSPTLSPAQLQAGCPSALGSQRLQPLQWSSYQATFNVKCNTVTYTGFNFQRCSISTSSLAFSQHANKSNKLNTVLLLDGKVSVMYCSLACKHTAKASEEKKMISEVFLNARKGKQRHFYLSVP